MCGDIVMAVRFTGQPGPMRVVHFCEYGSSPGESGAGGEIGGWEVREVFGWGVVFSEQTLSALQRSDARTATQILDAFNHWDDIEVNFKGRQIRSSGHGFCGIGRRKLLDILQNRCSELGVNLRFETDVTD